MPFVSLLTIAQDTLEIKGMLHATKFANEILDPSVHGYLKQEVMEVANRLMHQILNLEKSLEALRAELGELQRARLDMNLNWVDPSQMFSTGTEIDPTSDLGQPL